MTQPNRPIPWWGDPGNFAPAPRQPGSAEAEGVAEATALPLAQMFERLVEQVAAGAQLAYAIYHSGKDFVQAMPEPVVVAYARACVAYKIGYRR